VNQVAIPVDVSLSEVARKRSLGEAIALCADVAGLEPKQLVIDGKPIDRAQWSRWTTGAEGILWPKLRGLMDGCGNDIPLLWMSHDRGFDLASLRKRETELERQLRAAREENAALRRVLQGQGVSA
jgi:hypothetical protein